MYIFRSAKSRQFFARFLAAKTLTLSFEEAAGPGAAAADSDDSHYLAAAAQFQAAQLERQRSGLESNTRKQTSAAVAAVVVAAHDRALKTMLSFSGELTIEKLCEIHGILSAGQAGLKDVGKLRNVTVRVGNKNCCLPSLVRPKLVLLCESANRMIATHSSGVSGNNVCPEICGALIFLMFVDIHPFADGNGRIGRIVCNWMLSRCGVPFVICFCSTPEQRRFPHAHSHMHTHTHTHTHPYTCTCTHTHTHIHTHAHIHIYRYAHKYTQDILKVSLLATAQINWPTKIHADSTQIRPLSYRMKEQTKSRTQIHAGYTLSQSLSYCAKEQIRSCAHIHADHAHKYTQAIL